MYNLNCHKRYITILKLYDKRDDFDFPIVKFSLISGNKQNLHSSKYTFHKLSRYYCACAINTDFFCRTRILPNKLLKQSPVDFIFTCTRALWSSSQFLVSISQSKFAPSNCKMISSRSFRDGVRWDGKNLVRILQNLTIT